MKKNLLSGILIAGLFSLGVQAQQSLFVPNGFTSNGIGTSTVSGNVGIGTSAPSKKLEVAGDGKFGTFAIGEGTNNLYLGFNTDLSFSKFDYTGTKYEALLYFDKLTGSLYYRGSNDGTTQTPGSPSYRWPLVITKDGNTAIGNGTFIQQPQAKLHVIGDAIVTDKLNIGTGPFPVCTTGVAPKLYVGGKIGAHEVIVSTTNWCDYVFENGYKLKPLNEVEKYIQAYKHLPEVPSEKQIVADGIAMGEMMKIHMKKIEELTLYMIELQKQNEKLAAEIGSLKK